MKTDDVLKALECCTGQGGCLKCPLYNPEYTGTCVKSVFENARILINRQKEEIADLKAKNKICAEVIARQDNEIINLSKSVDNYESCLKSVEVIRVNAIKEFAEELKGELTTGAGTMRGSVLNIIDSLVKEMTEEHNAEKNSI